MGQPSNGIFSSSERFEAFRRWAKLKQYQIEVTYAVNTYTPVEKVFFYSLVLILFTLSAAGLALYLIPPILGLLRSTCYILGHDVPLIASHIGAANKMVRESPNGPVASPLESYAMSL